MLATHLQPLAEAQAAETGKAWVVCTIFGAQKPGDSEGTPLDAAGADDCPLCIAGHHCASAPSHATPGALVNLGAPTDHHLNLCFPPWSLVQGPVAIQPGGGIRAPPVSA